MVAVTATESMRYDKPAVVLPYIEQVAAVTAATGRIAAAAAQSYSLGGATVHPV